MWIGMGNAIQESTCWLAVNCCIAFIVLGGLSWFFMILYAAPGIPLAESWFVITGSHLLSLVNLCGYPYSTTISYGVECGSSCFISGLVFQHWTCCHLGNMVCPNWKRPAPSTTKASKRTHFQPTSTSISHSQSISYVISSWVGSSPLFLLGNHPIRGPTVAQCHGNPGWSHQGILSENRCFAQTATLCLIFVASWWFCRGTMSVPMVNWG